MTCVKSLVVMPGESSLLQLTAEFGRDCMYASRETDLYTGAPPGEKSRFMLPGIDTCPVCTFCLISLFLLSGESSLKGGMWGLTPGCDCSGTDVCLLTWDPVDMRLSGLRLSINTAGGEPPSDRRPSWEHPSKKGVSALPSSNKRASGDRTSISGGGELPSIEGGGDCSKLP